MGYIIVLIVCSIITAIIYLLNTILNHLLSLDFLLRLRKLKNIVLLIILVLIYIPYINIISHFDRSLTLEDVEFYFKDFETDIINNYLNLNNNERFIYIDKNKRVCFDITKFGLSEVSRNAFGELTLVFYCELEMGDNINIISNGKTTEFNGRIINDATVENVDSIIRTGFAMSLIEINEPEYLLIPNYNESIDSNITLTCNFWMCLFNDENDFHGYIFNNIQSNKILTNNYSKGANIYDDTYTFNISYKSLLKLKDLGDKIDLSNYNINSDTKYRAINLIFRGDFLEENYTIYERLIFIYGIVLGIIILNFITNDLYKPVSQE